MDLPVVEHAEQKRPSLKASAISELIKASSGQEQALYVLLAATGMRVSEALAVEIHHFTNDGRTINVEQQVEKDSPRIVKYLKTAAAKRQVDLHPDIAEYLQRYAAAKPGLLFDTANGTPHLYGNLEDRWLTPRLTKMGLDEEVYSHLHEELQLRLDEATRVGYGFALPAFNNVSVVPNVPKLHQNSAVEIAA